MIYVDSVSKSFGSLQVLRDASCAIADGERVGLVGPNGSGKSTLLRLIAGADEPDSGAAGWRGGELGLLRQEAHLDDAHTLVEELWTAFPEARAIERELAEVAQRIESADADLDALIEHQTELFERFDALDGYRIDRRIGRVLDGLGFAVEDRDRPCGAFSGGWRMRIELAKVLVHRPEHVVLDEPTNHLDAAARDWLALELSEYRGTVLLVTHDTAFHDVVVNRVLELRDGCIESYTGNYSDYLRQKAEQISQQERAAARQERELILRLGEPGVKQLLDARWQQAVDALAREVIAAAGHGEAFGHSLGHGLGLEVHEAPRLAKTADGALAEGAVVTIEPGIYRPDWGGVRIEDDVHLGPDGPVILTHFDRELIELG